MYKNIEQKVDQIEQFMMQPKMDNLITEHLLKTIFPTLVSQLMNRMNSKNLVSRFHVTGIYIYILLIEIK